jgi:hypothetical protein
LQGGKKVVSVSIDGTVRGWSLERKVMGEWMVERRKREAGGGEDEDEGKGKKGEEGVLTAEEEAELAELMDSDD